MIAETLAWLKALDEGATGKLWEADEDAPGVYDVSIKGEAPLVCEGAKKANAALIAHVRNVLPQLIGCVEMLQWYAEQARVHCRQDIGPAWAPLYTKDDGQHARVALTALAAAVEKESGCPHTGER